jgi:hypothetical protein
MPNDQSANGIELRAARNRRQQVTMKLSSPSEHSSTTLLPNYLLPRKQTVS